MLLRELRITGEVIRALDGCEFDAADFEAHHPKGLLVNMRNLRRLYDPDEWLIRETENDPEWLMNTLAHQHIIQIKEDRQEEIMVASDGDNDAELRAVELDIWSQYVHRPIEDFVTRAAHLKITWEDQCR